jgi:hypothetical protein
MTTKLDLQKLAPTLTGKERAMVRMYLSIQ